jgi:hypothetical protein
MTYQELANSINDCMSESQKNNDVMVIIGGEDVRLKLSNPYLVNGQVYMEIVE